MYVSHLVEKYEFEFGGYNVRQQEVARKNIWKCVAVSIFIQVGIFLFSFPKRLTLLLRSI